MFPAPISDYQAPSSIEAALALLTGDDDTMLIAGGMSLMQAMKARLVRPSRLIDLQNIPGLRGITVGPGGITIGAMTRYREIAESDVLGAGFGALTDATSHVGDRQVRNRGTIGGSLCWNYVTACTPVASIAVGASVVLQSTARGRHSIAVEDFLVSPMETTRQPDEIAIAVTLPTASARLGSAYRKWGLVADALPVVGLGVCLALDESGRCASARVGIGGLSNGSQRFSPVEKHLVGLHAGQSAQVAEIFDAAAAAAEVEDDLWTDKQHRRTLIRTLGVDAAASAFIRAGAAKP